MRLLIATALLTTSFFATAQDRHLVPKEKWSKDLYISDEFCAKQGLQPGETNSVLRAWNNPKENADFTRVVNIIKYFATPEDAAKYLDDHKIEMSENGDPEDPGAEIKGEHVMAFHDGANLKKLNDELGLKSHMHIFLFTEKNYVSKVFVSSTRDVSNNMAAIFAVESAKRLSAAIR